MKTSHNTRISLRVSCCTNRSSQATSTCIMHVYTNRLYLTQIKDCNVVASKLILILDDLLWVLTDSQLKAMVQYAKSLSEAMEKSAQQRKSMATEDQVHTRLSHTEIHKYSKYF